MRGKMDFGTSMIVFAVVLAVAGVLHSLNSRVPAPAVSKLAEVDAKWKAEKAERELAKENLAKAVAVKEAQKDLEAATPISPKLPVAKEISSPTTSDLLKVMDSISKKMDHEFNILQYRVSSLEKRQPQAVHMLPPTQPIEVIVVERPRKTVKAKPKPLLERAGVKTKSRDR